MELIDAQKLKASDLNKLIVKQLQQYQSAEVINPHSMHNIAIGMSLPGVITVRGSTGFYTGGFLEGSSVIVDGNVGWYAGDNMACGELIVKKNAGCNAGTYFTGGTMVIHGNAGSRAGYGMKGGTIIICGSSGRWSGQMTLGGRLIILGAVGDKVGESMYKGTLYVQDPDVATKLGGNVYLDKLTAAELADLDQLFIKYKVTASASNLQAIRPAITGRHSYTLFNPQLTHKPKQKLAITQKGGC